MSGCLGWGRGVIEELGVMTKECGFLFRVKKMI